LRPPEVAALGASEWCKAIHTTPVLMASTTITGKSFSFHKFLVSVAPFVRDGKIQRQFTGTKIREENKRTEARRLKAHYGLLEE